MVEGEDCVDGDACSGSRECAAKEKGVCAADGWIGSAESAADRLALGCELVCALAETPKRQSTATQRAAENFIRKSTLPPSEMQRNGRQCNASRRSLDLF